MSVSAAALRAREYDDREGPAELTLVELLEAQAREDNLSGARLAQRLRINHAFWSRVRRGLERFGPEACAKVVQAYPHLRPAALRYLADRYEPGAFELLADTAQLTLRPSPHGEGP
jgi:hypothetical protein